MSEKPTPGPWKVLEFATGIKGFIAIVTEPPDNGVAEHICDVFPFGKRPGADSRELAQHNANARLIASAPALLAAGRRMLDMLTLDGEPNALAVPTEIVTGDQVNEFTEAFADLEAAIANAEGRHDQHKM